MTPLVRGPRRARLVVGLLLTLLGSVLGWDVAHAHTDFESSTPADGAVVDGPLTEVVVDFTNPARVAGDGFQLLDPDGAIREPDALDETDGTAFILTFDPPLEAGTYGVRWNVQAGDAHPIDGSFRFEVTGPAASTTELPPTTASASDDVADAATPTTPAAVAVADDAGDTGAPQSSTSATGSTTALEEFLADSGDDTTAAARIGRTLSILGMIFGVGVLAALLSTVRGHRHELVAHLAWIRLAGLVVFAGGLIEFAVLVENDPSSDPGSLLATKAGIATVLKMLGGLAAMVGFHRRAGTITVRPQPLSSAVATVGDPGVGEGAEPGEHRWSPTATATVGIVGYVLVLVSFWFDGHTVSEGPWAVHALVNLVHLVAAAVWGGGVFAMTTVAWMRHRRAERTGLAAMVVRFSSVATVSLAMVIVAGLVLAVLILDSPGDLVGTTWGKVLIAKTAAVAVAAALGAYNHFRLRPALESRPGDPTLLHELRVTLSVESVVFVVVAVLTAVLVAAST